MREHVRGQQLVMGNDRLRGFDRQPEPKNVQDCDKALYFRIPAS